MNHILRHLVAIASMPIEATKECLVGVASEGMVNTATVLVCFYDRIVCEIGLDTMIGEGA